MKGHVSSRHLALTRDLVARLGPPVERPAERTDEHLTPLTDVEFENLARKLVRDCSPGPFWVFVYGSLLWKPSFEPVEQRRATVLGWRRAFCLSIQNYRATPAAPGLMLALARGGSCVGAAHRLPDDDMLPRVLALLRREIIYQEDLAHLRWLTARTPAGPVRALTFYCSPVGDPDFVHLDEAEQARRLATAVGFAGSCAEYLYNTLVHFAELGIRDSYLWRMQALVAREIEARIPDPLTPRPAD